MKKKNPWRKSIKFLFEKESIFPKHSAEISQVPDNT